MYRKGVGGKVSIKMSNVAENSGMIGVDVSSGSLTCCLRLSREGKPSMELEVSNSVDGIRKLLSCMPSDAPWVVEPTGRYSLLVVKQAQEAGRCVLLAPPRKAKIYLNSVQTRAKTDKLDGRGLALFGLTHSLSPYPIKSENVDQFDQLLSARKGLSRAMMSLRLQRDALPYAEAKAALQPAIEKLTEQIKALDKQIAQRCQEHPDFAASQKLLKVPGIGPVTAAAMASRLSSKQFSRPEQFVAYVGLDVGIRQSGKRDGHTGLTKQGDAELRRLLFICAKAALTAKDNPFKEQYKRERDKGLSSTAAFCAVARKLARLCWSIHRHNSEYDPQRVNNRPVTSAQTPTEPCTENKNQQTLDNQP
jgi:transposase